MAYQDRASLRFLTSAEILFSNLVSVLKLVPCYVRSKILPTVSWRVYFLLSDTKTHTQIRIQKMNYSDQILNSTEQPQCHQRLRGQQHCTFNESLHFSRTLFAELPDTYITDVHN